MSRSLTEKRQCSSTSKRTGQQCGQYVAPGFTVCKWHGAKAPQVQKTARQRLAEEVMPAIARLATERDNEEATPSERIRASTAILDRSGYGPSVNVQLDDARQSLVEKLRAIRSAVPDAAGELEVLDAEIVDDDD